MLKKQMTTILAMAFVLFISTFTFTQVAYSQQIAIKGIVKDQKGEPIIGANVVERGTTNGVTTDANGKFTINARKDAELVISFIGYLSQNVKTAGNTNLSIVIQEEAQSLDEVVVLGYGTQARAKVTSSVVKLDNTVLKHATFSNPGSALQGSVTGLRVTNTSGQPGKAPTITFRGGAIISDNLADFSKAGNSPLVLVDGVIRDLDDLDANNIESMTVLKDASATAIYGARANNGVILVVTKRGKSGVGNVTYSMKTGLNYNPLNGNDRVSASDYIKYSQIAADNSYRLTYGKPQNHDNQVFVKTAGYDYYGIGPNTRKYVAADLANGFQMMPSPIFPQDTLMFKDHSKELREAAFVNPALTQDHSISFSGGNDKGVFFTSLGYYTQGGTVKNTDYTRYSGSLSGSYKIKDNLEVFGATSISSSSTPPLYIDESSFFLRATRMVPTWQPYLADGTPNPGTSTSDGNPEYYLERFIRENNTRRLTYNMGLKWTIIKDLILSTENSIYLVDISNNSFDKAYQLQGITAPNTTRTAYAEYRNTNQMQSNLKLDYKKSFDKHNMSALIGVEYFRNKAYYLYAEGNKAPTDDISTLNASAVPVKVNSTVNEYRLMSWFSRLTYDYNNKYLITLVARMDGTSVLSEENRWGLFTGFSAGWNMHQEDFYKDLALKKYISEFKPRISYGTNGNVAGIGPYEVQGGYTPNSFTYNLSQGLLNNGVVNKSLRWERSKTFEVGSDMGFLDNRIMLSADYFNRITGDLLTNLALPDYTGFKTVRTNLGDLQNSGYEFGVDSKIFRNNNGFSWNLGFNVSFVENKIINLPYNGQENNRQGGQQVYDPVAGKIVWVGGYQEGQTMGNVYAYNAIKVLKDWDDVTANANNLVDMIAGTYGPAAYAALTPAQKANTGLYKPLEPGDNLWEDVNKDGIINTLDQTYAGNIFPKWTGGFSTTLGYKGFSLYGRFDFAAGHIIYNYMRSLDLGIGSFSYPKNVSKMWTPENTDTDLPKLFSYDPGAKMNYIRKKGVDPTIINNSGQMLESGDYLAVREITLNYDFPNPLISKLKLASLSANITAQNLHYFTAYNGMNPEYGGVDNGRYPMPLTILFGLKAAF